MFGRVLSRRRFLSGAAAGAAGLAFVRPLEVRAGGNGLLALEARPGTARLFGADKAETAIWGYQGAVPGPTIRVPQGGEVAVRLLNRLDEPTTIHWHGIRIANAMDGVAHMTQAPVGPGESFDYRFMVPDAGTFWYHPHVHGSGAQLDRGLSGLLIVEEASPPDVDRDVALQFDDWLIGADGEIDAASFADLHEAAHAGRLGNVLTVNGTTGTELPVEAGERVRLRIVSTCNARILKLGFGALDPWVVALDGQPVAPYRLGADPLVLGPAQRADLIADMPDEPGGRIAISEVSSEPHEAMTIVLSADKTRPARSEPPGALPANPVSAPVRVPARSVDLVMTGGMMRMIQTASYQGKVYDGQALAMEHGIFWAFNGVAGMPEAPLFSAKAGEPVALRLVNDTLWPHAIHVHGHHFAIYDTGGSPLPGLRDTIVIAEGGEATIGLLADNPGRWMIHCHMLEHQATGMETWFEVFT